MANKQLEGQIFNHDGVNYLVVEGNDWDSDTLRVKSVDGRRIIVEMPTEHVQTRLAETNARRNAQRA